MRFLLALLLLLLLSPSSHAALSVSLEKHSLDLWRERQTTTTIARYLAFHPEAIVATTSAYSNRRGVPVGLLMLDGIVRQGNYRRRCFLQIDRTGKRVEIGYVLHPWAYEAFAAGPCITVWKKDGRSGVYIAAKEERFSRAFVNRVANRSVLCLDAGRRRVVFLRFRGSLWLVPNKMRTLGLERCIVLDGGSQLSRHAIQPAVLALLPN